MKIEDIKNMTSDEVRSELFKGKSTTDLVAMPEAVAIEVVQYGHFDKSLQDWAWQTLEPIVDELDEELQHDLEVVSLFFKKGK